MHGEVVSAIVVPVLMADESKRKTLMTFSGPVEIPGRVADWNLHVQDRPDLRQRRKDALRDVACDPEFPFEGHRQNCL